MTEYECRKRGYKDISLYVGTKEDQKRIVKEIKDLGFKAVCVDKQNSGYYRSKSLYVYAEPKYFNYLKLQKAKVDLNNIPAELVHAKSVYDDTILKLSEKEKELKELIKSLEERINQ